MSTPALRLDWCSHAAAKYAVEHWHYSQSLPTPPLVKIGVWEMGRFIGCVLFSRGANNNIGRPYGLVTTQICELTRVALAPHRTPTSRVVAIALRFLTRSAGGLRLCVSYADPNQGHHGGIYQAGGWLYVGDTPPSSLYLDRRGRQWHQRQVSVTGIKPQYGTLRRVPVIAECVKVPQLGKHRYLMPLDPELRRRLLPLAQPYPKAPYPGRASRESEAPAIQAGEGAAMRPHGSHDC